MRVSPCITWLITFYHLYCNIFILVFENRVTRGVRDRVYPSVNPVGFAWMARKGLSWRPQKTPPFSFISFTISFMNREQVGSTEIFKVNRIYMEMFTKSSWNRHHRKQLGQAGSQPSQTIGSNWGHDLRLGITPYTFDSMEFLLKSFCSVGSWSMAAAIPRLTHKTVLVD